MNTQHLISFSVTSITLLVLTLAVQADPAPVSKPTTVTSKLVYADGKPAADAAVIIDLVDIKTKAVTVKTFKADADGNVSFTIDRSTFATERPCIYMASPTGIGFPTFHGPNGVAISTLQPFTSLRVHLVDSKGKPIPNVRISPSMFATDHVEMSWSTAIPGDWSPTSDATGCATLQKLPQGVRVTLCPTDERFAPTDFRSFIQLANAAVTPDVTLQLNSPSSISGTIVYETTHKPAAGVKVTAFTRDYQMQISDVTTDSTGHYTLSKLGPGTYVISMVDNQELLKDWIANEKTVHLHSGEQAYAVTVTLTHGGVVTGKITDKSTGKPVPNVPVMAAAPTMNNYVGDTTGPDGTYRFHILPGTYDMRLNYHELWNDQTLVKHFEILGNETKTFDYQIDAPSAVHGVVLGPDGKPIPGADVTPSYMQQRSRDLQTGADGKFVFDNPGLTRNSTIVARVHLPTGDLATEAPYVYTGTDSVVLHLAAGVLSTVTGLVKDKNGQPVPNAKVNLYRNQGSYGTGVGSANTDANGRYTFPSNFGNSKYQVEVDSSGYTTAWSANLDVPAKQTFEFPAIVVTAASGFVGGTLLDVKGNPIAGASISDNQRQDIKTTTDNAGHFLLKGMATGQVVLTIQTTDGLSDYPQMDSGRSDYILYMPSPVNGVVLGPDGRPIAGAKVSANVSQYAAQTFITDSMGQFTIGSPGLKPKTELLARSGGMSTPAPVVYNGESQLTLRLSDGGLCTITGQIQDTDGNPVRKVVVKLIRQGYQVSGELEDATSDAQGRYTFAPIYGNSKYRVLTSPLGYGSGNSDQFLAGAGLTVRAPTLKLGIADAFTGGTVVDAKGNPVAGATLTDQDITSLYTTTDRAGHFTLKNVPRGKTNVFVVAQDGSTADQDLSTGRGDNIIYVAKPGNQH